MAWQKLVGLTVGLMVLFFCKAASPQVVTTSTNCRRCPEECFTVPRSDGSCSICVCNGVALPDCPNLPEVCPIHCKKQVDEGGCTQCACRRANPVICPPLPPCPEECQQLMDEDGCPKCLCDAPPRNCPAITCPELCTEEVGDDGCLSCRCQRTEICPAMRPCLRGCIDLDVDSGCFTCNCTIPSEDPVVPPSGNQFGIGPFGFINERPFGGDLSEEDDLPLPMLRCRNARLRCPPGCRTVVAAHGCRECMCGEDNYLCPGVPACKRLCLFLSPEDKCCRCQCSRPNTGVLSISVVRVPPFKPFRPFGQVGPFKPFGTFGPFGPFLPDTGFRGDPSLPPQSPGPSGNRCTVDPASCNPACRVITDSEGCPLCDCPGDLCPRIRCPARCVQQLGPNGCPECDCGGRPEPVNPDAEPIDPTAPMLPADPLVPVAPDAPAEPAVPVNPGIPLIPIEPVDPNIAPEPAMPPGSVGMPDPDIPIDPATPGEPMIPVDPNVPSMTDVPSAPVPSEPVAPVDFEPFNPVAPGEETGSNLPAPAPEELPVVPVEIEPFNPVSSDEPTNPNIPASPDSNVPASPDSNVPASPDSNVPASPGSNLPVPPAEPDSFFESSLPNIPDASLEGPETENVIPTADVPEPRDFGVEAAVSP